MELQRDREFNEQYKGQQIKNITPVYCNANLLMRHISSVQLSIRQGCAKTRIFHQKPSPVGLTVLNRVLMGFMG